MTNIGEAVPIGGEWGRISFSVRGMVIFGNLLGLLLKIEEVGDDIRHRGRISAPIIAVSDMEANGAA
ncbi:MAG: hypothetical protein GY721_05190 [Deltaproteobacteria bacterium]|nr:hypothetical protein [Deltaproteobacteria bacterium]